MDNSVKNYENVGRRILLKDDKETRDLLLKDTFHEMKEALATDGHTGYLDEGDGILRSPTFQYKGYKCCIASVIADKELADTFNADYPGRVEPGVTRVYWGWYRRENLIIGAEADDLHPTSYFLTPREAGQIMQMIIDEIRTMN